MTDNLALELDRFRERVKQDPGVADVKWKAGSGGGSFGWLLLALLGAHATRRYRHRTVS